MPTASTLLMYTAIFSLKRKRDIKYLVCCSLVFPFTVAPTSAWEQTNPKTVVEMQFSGGLLPPATPLQLSCTREGRCVLHQVRLSQLEPLIITSQYQLQQPCADAKSLRGLATLPYLIWEGSTETVLYHQPIQSGARTAPHPASVSNHSPNHSKSHDLAT